MNSDVKNEDFAVLSKKKSFLTFFTVLILIILVGLSVFFTIQKRSLSIEVEKVDFEISSLKNEISLLENEKVEVARTAQVFLSELKNQEIMWSRVISRIHSLIPYDGKTQKSKVNFMSYSGSVGGKINVNAVSRFTSKDPLDDVAETIAVFNDTSYFKNAIVPSVSLGENDQGEKNASFSLIMDYVESSSFEFEENDEDSTDPRISRQ